GQLKILREGKTKKFVQEVEHRTFSGAYAGKRGQPVLYVTERCVFQLTNGGLELIEIAPGVDLERDILAQMSFRPTISPQLRLMDARIFADAPMGLRAELQSLPLDKRLSYNAEQNLFFVNFENLNLRRAADIEAIRQLIEQKLGSLEHKVYAIINYDNFSISPELLDTYVEMVRDVVTRFYSRVTRYTTSAFTRAQIGDALSKRELAPHIFDNQHDALAKLKA
ncbi:MAG: propionate CoA-transferase, partial [Pseudomonadota bacterium]|nr:propionate CoA-transferase [Pseudomonadota bacterium]